MTVRFRTGDILDHTSKVPYCARVLRPLEGPDRSTAEIQGVLVRLPASCCAPRARASLIRNVVVVALLLTHF